MNFVSMLKDHVTILNLLNLCGFPYPFVIFLMCRRTIVKSSGTTWGLQMPGSRAVQNLQMPTPGKKTRHFLLLNL